MGELVRCNSSISEPSAGCEVEAEFLCRCVSVAFTIYCRTSSTTAVCVRLKAIPASRATCSERGVSPPASGLCKTSLSVRTARLYTAALVVVQTVRMCLLNSHYIGRAHDSLSPLAVSRRRHAPMARV